MSFRTVFSNVSAVVWGDTSITGVEEISLTEDASRVAGAADDELHESIQFIGVRTTQVTLSLQSPPSFVLPSANTSVSANAKSLAFVCKGRMGAADRSYIIQYVQWFNLSTNGAFGNMRRWNLTGHAVIDTGATPVTAS